MKMQRAKGCYDLLPLSDEDWKQPHLWRFVESTLHKLAPLYGFQEIRTPLFESTELFVRSVGEESDIVCKEMYTFEDKGGRSLSLRPELTAPVIRAYIENHLDQKGIDRLYYAGPCFRYERAQKNRYRQFSQLGIEIFGEKDSLADVESIALLMHLYRELGLNHLTLLINSIGDFETRKSFTVKLCEYFARYEQDLSEDSKRRLSTNPLRILDSKDSVDKKIATDAPKLLDFLSPSSKEHFERVCDHLLGIGIPFTIDTHLVRGLDYYTDTVFEVVASNDLAAQNTIGAGGCYDGLMKTLGGPDLPGTGWATGVERIISALLREHGEGIAPSYKPTCYCIPLSDSCRKFLFPYVQKLRSAGVATNMHLKNFNLKKALGQATKLQADYACILGEKEIVNEAINIKNLNTREEKTIPLEQLTKVITHYDTLQMFSN